MGGRRDDSSTLIRHLLQALGFQWPSQASGATQEVNLALQDRSIQYFPEGLSVHARMELSEQASRWPPSEGRLWPVTSGSARLGNPLRLLASRRPHQEKQNP